MLVNKVNWSSRNIIYPLETSLPVIIGIDQSKSGYAVTTGDEFGNEIDYIEMSGTGMNTDDFITEMKLYMLTYFSKVKILLAGYEKMILKKGLGYYHSSEVLHDVRVATKEVLETLGVTYTEVNNMAWKGAILPDGYRGRDEKGSLRYCKELDPKKFYKATDNRTDSFCIYQYLVKMRGVPKINCTCKESSSANIIAAIIPEDNEAIKAIKKEFIYNYEFSVSDNINYFSNRSTEPGKAYINIDLLSFEDIYRYSRFFSSQEQEPVLIVMFEK